MNNLIRQHLALLAIVTMVACVLMGKLVTMIAVIAALCAAKWLLPERRL